MITPSPSFYPFPHASTSSPLQPTSRAHPNLLPSSHPQPRRTPKAKHGMSAASDTEASASSPEGMARGRCFCGTEVDEEGGIYCSVACARSDAFSSLCYKPSGHQTHASTSSLPPSLPTHPRLPQLASLASSLTSAPLSRNPSSASSYHSSASADDTSSSQWDSSSHYRRLARADLRREERREERRRRRAEGSVASSTMSRGTMMSSISSSSSSSRAGLPELVGGGGAHSRNPSIASSVSSVWTAGGLSRNASSASSRSNGRYGGGGGINVDAVIMEHDDESEEFLTTDPYPAAPSLRQPQHPHHRRHKSGGSKSGKDKEKERNDRKLEAFGMGKDMRDVLEEIIQMEKGFLVSDTEDAEGDDAMGMVPPQALFATTFEGGRPPRTPPPPTSAPTGTRRLSEVPAAPNAPSRAGMHRAALSHSHAAAACSPETSFQRRPPSLMGLHQSSLSESHTALYLATASPVPQGRNRSASPKLEARKSISFSPDVAGPTLQGPGSFLAATHFGGSPNVTPSRRRPNLSPSAHHPTMDHWRFPSAGSQAATPTRPSASSSIPPNAPGRQSSDSSSRKYETPVKRQHTLSTHSSSRDDPSDASALLWPPPPQPLAPALFPSSPSSTPDFPAAATLRPEAETASLRVGSGIKLGVLLGSGEGQGDVEMSEGEEDEDEEDEGASTAHGHGSGVRRRDEEYLPVFLEAEGFMAGRW